MLLICMKSRMRGNVDRSATNGIRLMKPLKEIPDKLKEAVSFQQSTTGMETVRDAVFKVYEGMYAYDRTRSMPE